MKKLALGIFVLQVLALATAAELNEIQTIRNEVAKDLTAPFSYTLDLDSSFDIYVRDFNGPSGQSSFCDPYPSEIASTVKWNGTIPAGTSFDNLLYFNGYFFALDTNSWRVLAATDMTNTSTYRYIEVDPSINHQANNDIPVLVIDDKHEILLILRRDIAVSYRLVTFFDAIRKNATDPVIPKISYSIEQWPNMDYKYVKSAKAYKGNLHVIVDNNLLKVWQIEISGYLVYNPTPFDLEFFNASAIDITDIVFKDNYAFVLDELNGVYALDVTNYLKYTYKNASDLIIPDARLIELTGNSLNVISMSKRSTVLHEYTISTTPSLSITLNREVELRDAVRSSFSDTNFLYYATGYQNIAAKHSIPGTYNTDVLKNGYTSYWPLANIGTVLSIANGSSSQVYVIQKTQVTVYTFSEAKATLRCRAGNYKQGTYTYTVISKQRTCKAKTTSSTNDVCIVQQEVRITIESNAKQMPSDSNNTGLIVGIVIALLSVAAIVFAYWFFKMRNKAPNPTVRNDVFFRRLSRSPLNQDASNLYKVTMDIDRSGARTDGKTEDIHMDDKLGDMRKKSDDFVLGPQRSDDAEESPKRAVIIRGKTFSELEKPKKPINLPKINTMSNLEHNYEGDV